MNSIIHPFFGYNNSINFEYILRHPNLRILKMSSRRDRNGLRKMRGGFGAEEKEKRRGESKRDLTAGEPSESERERGRGGGSTFFWKEDGRKVGNRA